jgi:hypothetical protein
VSRLTEAARERLAAQLIKALVPDRTAEIAALAEAAFAAVLADFFTPAGLKRIATLPDEWLTSVGGVVVKPSQSAQYYRLESKPRRLPRSVPDQHTLGPAAQAAVDRWASVTNEAAGTHKSTSYEVRRVLDTSTTLEAVLTKLPAARGILSLPDAAEPDAVAARLNARLTERAAPPAKPPAEPPAPTAMAKPARKR